MEILPVRNSVDSLFYKGVEHLNKSENGFVKHVVTRTVQMVAIPPIMVLSVLYNVLAIALKAPVSLARYTIGFIPTEKGRLAEMFPEDSSASHMAWHAYKILFFWIDMVPLYLVGIVHPGANVFIHKKMALIPSFVVDVEVDKTNPDNPEIRIGFTIPSPPPLPALSFTEWNAKKSPGTKETKGTGTLEAQKKRPLPSIPMNKELLKAIGDKQKTLQAKRDLGLTIESQIPVKDKVIAGFNLTTLGSKIDQFKSLKDAEESEDSVDTDEDAWNTSGYTPSLSDIGSYSVFSDALAEIMNAPKVTYKIEEAESKAPVQVVPTDMAKSDHYKKMAHLRMLEEEDDSDWEL